MVSDFRVQPFCFAAVVCIVLVAQAMRQRKCGDGKYGEGQELAW